MHTNAVTKTATLALAVALLAGCGSKASSSAGGSGNYCSDLKTDKTYFATLSGGSSSSDMSRLPQVFQRLHALAHEAPSNVAADWKTLDTTLTTLQNALAQAGIKPSDLAMIAKGQTPPGVDLSKLQALAPKLQSLSSTNVSGAANRIAADAKKSCGVDLNGS